ncbi:uncharacterized protein G2W53_041401 [Senna tora]|uniref:Uncharacterized protein n=1 Tax=Senna tora TaxID=362788 RepID=A0A834SH13_9FABA|nr:uncharacterized protein G2W53_041401 [Senna tora]
MGKLQRHVGEAMENGVLLGRVWRRDEERSGCQKSLDFRFYTRPKRNRLNSRNNILETDLTRTKSVSKVKKRK